MSLKEQLSSDLKEAMKSGDAVRRTVVRSIMVAIKEAEMRQREDLVKKALKQHGVERPSGDDPDQVAAYEKAVDAALAAEKVDEKSQMGDSDILGTIQKLVKQRQDSIADAEKASRPDIIAAEQAEIVVLEGYLPKQMTREEVEAEARKLIEKTGASSPRDMGKVMGPLMNQLQGRADGKLVSEVVKSLLG